MSEDDLTEKIKSELLKSGFPLELSCRRDIFAQKWGLSLNRFYVDSENVEREIDVIAHKQTIFPVKDSLHNMVNSILIVECKKNETNHWVFFDEDLRIQVLNVISTLEAKRNEELEQVFMRTPDSLRHHHYIEAMSTSSFCMAFKSSKNQIFEGLQQLFSAYKHQREGTEKHMGEPRNGIWINVYYPAIVFDGKLFIAKLVNGDLEVQEAEHLLYTMQHPAYLGTWVTIDVVRADRFSNYLQNLGRDHEIIVTYIRSKLAKVIAKPSVRVKSPTVERIRKLHPRAYEKWSPDEEKLLTQEFQKGVAIKELAKLLQRQPSAIHSRFIRLGLINEGRAT